MTGLPEEIARVVRDLEARGVAFALVGGLGVSVYVEPRFTKDIDLVVAVAGDDEAEALVSELRAAGYFVDSVIEQKATGRLATVRLIASAGDGLTHVDLLFASSGIEPEIVAASRTESIGDNARIPVARPGHLVALKLLATDANRPQDPLDLKALGDVLTEEEWVVADAAVRLITARGYHRQRDLLAALAKLRAGARSV